MKRLVPVVALCAACSGGSADAPRPDAVPTIDAPPETCDTVVQDCASHGSVATPKCSLTEQVSGDLVTRCVSLDGTLAEGELCNRIGGPGIDDCDIGRFCSGLAQPQNPDGTVIARRCRNFCRGDATCLNGEHCVVIGANLPQDGLCVPSGCALFSDTCGATMTCDTTVLIDRIRHIGLCRSIGNVAAGGDCSVNLCVANTACVLNSDGAASTCRAYCDASHPCPGGADAGMGCIAVSGLADGGGYCP